MAISRPTIVDDDGTGTTGTIADAAWVSDLCDRLDSAIDGATATTRTVAKGGTGVATLAANGIVYGNGTSPVGVTAGGAAGQVLTSNGTGVAPTFQSGGVAGSTTQVQFNDAGVMAGDAGLTYDKTTDALTMGSMVATLGQIKFPATQNASADANTLDDYEEGTWTPTDASGAALTFTGVSAAYVKIGQLVIAGFELVYPTTANGSAARIGGLPFTALATPTNGWSGVVGYTNSSIDFRFLASGTSLFPYKTDGAQPTNVNLSTFAVRGIIIYRASA